MPSRMPSGHMLPSYPDPYQPRMNQGGRMAEGMQGQQPLGGMESLPGRPGDMDQAALDDLLSELAVTSIHSSSLALLFPCCFVLKDGWMQSLDSYEKLLTAEIL